MRGDDLVGGRAGEGTHIVGNIDALRLRLCAGDRIDLHPELAPAVKLREQVATAAPEVQNYVFLADEGLVHEAVSRSGQHTDGLLPFEVVLVIMTHVVKLAPDAQAREAVAAVEDALGPGGVIKIPADGLAKAGAARDKNAHGVGN